MTFNEVSEYLIRLRHQEDQIKSEEFYKAKDLQRCINWIIEHTNCTKVVAESVAAYRFLLESDDELYDIVLDGFFNTDNKSAFIRWAQDNTSCSDEAAELLASREFDERALLPQIPTLKSDQDRPVPECSRCRSLHIATVNEMSARGTGAPINICQCCGYSWHI